MTITSRNRPYLIAGVGMLLQIFLLMITDYPVTGLHNVDSFFDAFTKLFLFPYIPTLLFMGYMGFIHPNKKNPKFLAQIFFTEAFSSLFILNYELYITKSVPLVLILTIVISSLNAVSAFNGYRKKLFGYLTGKHLFYIRCYVPYIYFIHKAILMIISKDILSALILLLSQLLITVSLNAIMRRAKFNSSGKKIELPKSDKITVKRSA